MTDELSSFIDAVYREPYSYFGNNCVAKSLKIRAKAKELGKTVEMVSCFSVVPFRRWHNFPIILPHFYVVIDGKKVDVSLDPAREQKYCRNSEKKLIVQVNISRLRRNVARAARFWSFVNGRAKRTQYGD